METSSQRFAYGTISDGISEGQAVHLAHIYVHIEFEGIFAAHKGSFALLQ
jgi:hypothetical protein